jgi:putative PIN family toxin of toxin-antitoxin system
VRIVLDTNVLVAGLLSPFGPPGEIVRMVSSGELTLCLDARVLSEYAEVLGRPKFGFDEDAVAALLDYVEYRGLVVASSPLPTALPDTDDEPFLAIALACGAEHLVTGNRAHFPEASCRGATVVSPADFAAVYRERPA